MKKKNMVLISIIALILIGVLFYSYPILPTVNPFYQSKISSYEDGFVHTREYWKYSLLPVVNSELPEGWSIKTKVYEENISLATVSEEREKLTGDVSIEIYKGEGRVASLNAITALGGKGGTYYKFPDSYLLEYEEMLKASEDEDSFVEIAMVEQGEYSEIELFGLEVRRVGYTYIPNIYEGEGDYFNNSLEPVIFSFGESRPQFKNYVNGELQEEHEPKYILRVLPDNLKEDDLKIVDSILESLEIR